MSSAREVGGMRGSSGRPASRRATVLTRHDQESLRRGFHDFEQRHGRRVTPARKPQWGNHAASRGQRTERLEPGSWHNRLVLALARTGDVKSAAVMAGVPYGTARTGIARNQELRARCQAAEGEHAWRRVEQVARGQITRWSLSPRKARLLLALRPRADAA